MPIASIIDLSHYNSVVHLDGAVQSGIKAVIHKATENLGFMDSKCAARYHLTKNSGLLWGLYHFLHSGDMVAQAKNFVSRSILEGVLDDQTLLACDLEVPGVTLSQVLSFMQTVESLTNRSPVLYSGHIIKDLLGGTPVKPPLANYRLWIPQYASAPSLPPGYDSYWAWQYSDKGTIPGIGGTVDLSACDKFDNWAGHIEAPVSPPVTSPPEPVKMEITLPAGVPLNISVNGSEVYKSI